MTPEISFEAVNASEARAPSAARLAAEAFFTPAPATVSTATAAEVTVVRHKKMSAVTLESSELQAARTPPPKLARAPRVFRLDGGTNAGSVADVIESTANDELSSAQSLATAAEQPPTLQSPLRRLPRKKAVRRHGEVTIIRPAVNKQALEEVALGEVSESMMQGSMHGSEPDWPRYPGLLKQLQVLQSQAEELRRSEVNVALRWIKAAIHDYDLTAEELGFR